MSERYQVMPPLLPIELAELRASIEMHGVQLPVIVDEHGAIIDGHHRSKLAAEIGVPCPRDVRVGLGEEAKRTLARTLNTARRMLTREQIRELIAGQLRDTPERSDSSIAKALKVSDKTVGSVRRTLESTSEISEVQKRTGADDKVRRQRTKRPEVHHPSAVANEVIVPKNCAKKPLKPLKLTGAKRKTALLDLIDASKAGRFEPYMGEMPAWLAALADDATDPKAASAGRTMAALACLNAVSLADVDVVERVMSECTKHGLDLSAFLDGAIYQGMRLRDLLKKHERRARQSADDVIDVEAT
ncbi:ParB N-terminal domain-containing protein [Paraburkholderia sp. BR10882]|uniref:ParB N-terminal domain-containing protein n=1 Tax=unclassified Paraburkholderia TaxID=2615204 RepID=UPI0034CED9E5